MKTLMTTGAAVTLLVLTGVVQAAEFDRSGLQLTLGVGAGQTDVGATLNDELGTDRTNNVAANFALGYGLSKQLAIYVGSAGTKVDRQENGDIALVSGVGASYHFSTEPDSFFVTGLYGRGRVAKAAAPDDESSAPAWLLGAGYQFSKHVQIQAAFFNSGSGETVSTTSHDFQGAAVTINLMLN